jgi:hypothetical protein
VVGPCGYIPNSAQRPRQTLSVVTTHHYANMSPFNFPREKIDTLASKMEDVAKVVIRVLSDNVKNPKASAQFREAPSILCLTLYSSNMSRTCWNEFDNTTAPNSHALSIHLCGHDRRICLRNLGGSTFCSLPAGCMLVTIGKQIQVTCHIHHCLLSNLRTDKISN